MPAFHRPRKKSRLEIGPELKVARCAMPHDKCPVPCGIAVHGLIRNLACMPNAFSGKPVRRPDSFEMSSIHPIAGDHLVHGVGQLVERGC